jgi:hypothetical protein
MMKSGAGSEADRRVRPLAVALAFSSMMLLGACASDFAMEDAVPHPAADGTYGGPRDTGQYPNLNIPQKAATSQLTDAQVTAKKKELDAAKARVEGRPANAAGISTDAATLRKAGKAQSEQLKDIEGQ